MNNEAQLKANKKWSEKNREHSNYLKGRSACKCFIKKATYEDLMEIKNLVNENINTRFDFKDNNDILNTICKEYILDSIELDLNKGKNIKEIKNGSNS